MKQIYLLIAFSGLLLSTTFAGNEGPVKRNLAIKTLVIDAGHGGRDPGCLGHTKVYEKHIALKIALKVGNYIEENFPDIEVIYTRKTDVFIELYERAAIANRAKADLFISIHCNANVSSIPYGTSTYVMGQNKVAANLEVAKRENAVILLEDNYAEHYDGFDPNSPETHIMFNLFQNAYQEQSIRLASKVQEQFETRANRRDRGVHHESFLVLYLTTMPAVLVETGFLTNAKEEAYLKTDQGQNIIASAIYRAFREFNDVMSGAMAEDNSIPEEDKAADEIIREKKVINEPQTNEIIVATSEPKSVVTEETEEIAAPVVRFKVQIHSSDKKLNTSQAKYHSLNDLDYYVSEEGIYKYTLGSYTKMEDAVVRQRAVRKKGFSDAFMVAFKDGVRISIKEALSISRQ